MLNYKKMTTLNASNEALSTELKENDNSKC